MAAAKKKRKKWVILIVAILLVGVGVFGYYSIAMSAQPQFPVVETMVLAKKDLQNTVSVTGNVESENSKKIFSKLSYPVKELLVEVGDRVEEGDILCNLDTKDLENAIAKQQATVNKSQTTANISLSEAQQELENARQTLEKELNTQLMTAQASVRTAEANLDKAAVNLRDSKDQYKAAKTEDYIVDSNGETDHDSLLYTYRNAEAAAQITYDEAKNAVADAKANLKAVEETVRLQMEKYETSVENAKKNMDFTDQYLAINELKEDLNETTVTAPVSGVVTGVYVTEGATPSGLMFVIEDTDNLKITTKVMEYDIASVKLGNPVEIKSDATGEDVYTGSLHKIAPTSVKNATGDSDTSSDAEFETEITVSGKTNLKIGMKTRLNIIYEEKKGVFAVPYDAIGVNENGESVVYVARVDENGAAFVHLVTVTPGLETDFDTEVTSSELQEGDLIITDGTGLTEGMQVTLMPGMGGMQAGAAGAAGEGGMAGMTVTVG